MFKPFVLGGVASIAAEFGTFPIDTTKTRLQIQGQHSEQGAPRIRYRGMLHALLRISQEEGVKALYGGIAPALLRQASYGTLKIGLYQHLKRWLATRAGGDSLYAHVAAGMTSGAVASAIANPTDVLKVRMQAATSPSYTAKRRSCVSLFKQIYSSEGLRGLYRGVIPTMQRAAIVAGVLLPSYDLSKKALLDTGLLDDRVHTHFMASFIAGVLGTIVANPVDVVKSRMMNQLKGQSGHTYYTGSLDCLVSTCRTEGIFALYRGFIPAYWRLGPWNIIFFVTYERLKVVL